MHPALDTPQIQLLRGWLAGLPVNRADIERHNLKLQPCGHWQWRARTGTPFAWLTAQCSAEGAVRSLRFTEPAVYLAPQVWAEALELEIVPDTAEHWVGSDQPGWLCRLEAAAGGDLRLRLATENDGEQGERVVAISLEQLPPPPESLQAWLEEAS